LLPERQFGVLDRVRAGDKPPTLASTGQSSGDGRATESRLVFWKRKHPSPPPSDPAAATLDAVVRAELGEADEETIRIVTAVAGLLGAVAYADRDFSKAEQAQVRTQLQGIRGLGSSSIDAICSALQAHALELATTQTPRFARTLKELGDRSLREQVLQLLLDLAAADGTISLDEANQLRLLTGALGLTQADYNRAQAVHRDKLASLRAGAARDPNR